MGNVEKHFQEGSIESSETLNKTEESINTAKYEEKKQEIDKKLQDSKISEIYDTLSENYSNWELDSLAKEKIIPILKQILPQNSDVENISDELCKQFLEKNWNISKKYISFFLKQYNNKTEIFNLEETNKEKSIENFLSNDKTRGLVNKLLSLNINKSLKQKSENYLKININNLEKIGVLNKKEIIEEENALKEIINELKKPWVLEDIAENIYELWWEEYSNFKEVIKWLDSGLYTRLVAYEAKKQVITSGDKLEKIKVKWDRIERKIDSSSDNSSYLLNSDLNGKNRSLKLEWAGYSIDIEDVDTKRIQELELVQKSANKALDSINEALDWISKVLLYIEEGEQNNYSLAEIKENIRQNEPEIYSSLWIESFNSLESLKNSLNAKFAEEEKKRDIIMKEFDEVLEKIVKVEFARWKEKLARQQEALKVMHELFLDRIPKEVLDMVIKNINTNPLLLSNLWLQRQIDIQNWDLWVDKDNDIMTYTIEEKQILVRLFNKMINWESKRPLIIDINGLAYINENWERLNNINMELFISQQMGSSISTEKIMTNLYKAEELETAN